MFTTYSEPGAVQNKRLVDRTGQRFGQLVVLKHEGRKNNRTYWSCQCDCGTLKIVEGDSLRSGRTRSCGCRQHAIRKGPGECGLNNVYRQYKRNARKRDISFLLSKEEVKTITQKECHYCGSKPIQVS